MVEVSVRQDDMLDRRQSALLLGRGGPTTIRPVLCPMKLLRRRIFSSHTDHFGLDGITFFFGPVFKRLCRVIRLKVGLTVAGLEAEVEEVRKEAVDVLLGGMGRARIDQYERGHVVRRRLEEVGVGPLKGHEPRVLTEHASDMSRELGCE